MPSIKPQNPKTVKSQNRNKTAKNRDHRSLFPGYRTGFGFSLLLTLLISVDYYRRSYLHFCFCFHFRACAYSDSIPMLTFAALTSKLARQRQCCFAHLYRNGFRAGHACGVNQFCTVRVRSVRTTTQIGFRRLSRRCCSV